MGRESRPGCDGGLGTVSESRGHISTPLAWLRLLQRRRLASPGPLLDSLWLEFEIVYLGKMSMGSRTLVQEYSAFGQILLALPGKDPHG